MKNGVKFFIIVISIILLFSIALGVCIGCISSYEGGRSYDTDESFMSVIGGIASQEEMQNKFGAYNHVETDSENTVLRIFSEEQADNIISQRKEGKKFYLTYDEALFLINDSVRLYFEYDTVVLNGAYDTGILSPESSLSAKTINCYHGDFSEFNYDGAVQAYNQMLNDISDIIRHRVAMLDSRIIPVVVIQHEFSGPYGYGFRFSFEGDYDFEEKKDPLEWFRSEQYVIVFDDGKSTDDEYKALVKSALLNKYSPIYFPSFSDTSFPIVDTSENKTDTQVYEYPFIQFYGFVSSEYEGISSGYIFLPVNPGISATNTNNRTNKVFPLQEITDMSPQWYLTPEYFNTDSITINLTMYHNIKSKRSWELATITDKQIIENIISAIGDKQAVCDTVNNEKENVTYDYKQYDGCFFVLDLNNGTSVVLPVSTYFKTAANVYKSTSDTSRIPMLYDSFPAEFINTVRDICKPYADKYMETDENGNYVYSMKTNVAEKYSEIQQDKKAHFENEYKNLKQKITPSMTQDDYDALPEYSELVHLINTDRDYCWIALKHCYDASDMTEQRFLLELAAKSVGLKDRIPDDGSIDDGVMVIWWLLTQGKV